MPRCSRGGAVLLLVSYLMSFHSSEVQNLSTDQILSTYLNLKLGYNYFRFGKRNVAILESFFRLQLRPYHSNRSAILHHITKFRPNRAIRGRLMTLYTISRWRLRRLHTTSGFVLVDVTVFGRSNSTWKPNFIQIGPPAAIGYSMTYYWFLRWEPRRRSTTSAFLFDDVTLFRRSTSIRKPIFVDISYPRLRYNYTVRQKNWTLIIFAVTFSNLTIFS